MTKTVDTEVVSSASHEATWQTAGHDLPEVISNEIAIILDKKEDVKLGPLDLLEKMIEAGVDMSQFPIIGSKGGNNPHLYPAVSDSGRDVEGDAFEDYFKGSDYGQTLVNKLKDVKLALKGEGQSKMYRDKEGNELFLKDEKSMIAGRITAATNLLTTAVAVYQKTEEFAAKADPKKVILDRNKYSDVDGNLHNKRSTTPFVLSDATTRGNDKRMTIQQVAKLDIGQAIKLGGTYTAFLATMKKEPTGAAADYKVANLLDCLKPMAAQADYLNPSIENNPHITAAQKFLGKAENQSHLMAMGALIEALDAVFAPHAQEYQRLVKATLSQVKSAAA